MKFTCEDHGEIDAIEADGYGLGHERQLKANELDLEGVMFTIHAPDDGEELTAAHVEPEQGAEDYLEKFADIYEEIAAAIQSYEDNPMAGEMFFCHEDPTGRMESSDCWVSIESDE